MEGGRNGGRGGGVDKTFYFSPEIKLFKVSFYQFSFFLLFFFFILLSYFYF